MAADDALMVALRWEQICDDLLTRTEAFPKMARYSLAQRMDQTAIGVLEVLVEARYTTGARRRDTLNEANLLLNRLRVLVRLSHRRRYLNDKAYEHVSLAIDEAGRLLGGWIRSTQRRPGDSARTAEEA
jgi:hypothetical protein